MVQLKIILFVELGKICFNLKASRITDMSILSQKFQR